MILGPNNNFGEKVSEHFLRDTKTHFYISQAHITPDHMVSDLKMTNVAQFGRIRRNMTFESV